MLHLLLLGYFITVRSLPAAECEKMFHSMSALYIRQTGKCDGHLGLLHDKLLAKPCLTTTYDIHRTVKSLLKVLGIALTNLCPWTRSHSLSLSHTCTHARTRTHAHTHTYTPSVLWRCWLGGRKGTRPIKNWVVGCWRGYLFGARCRLAYGPADATATHCLLLQ